MTSLSRLALLAAILAMPLLHAGRGNGDPRLEKLYSQFMAPCCWAENLLAHSSPLAGQMRGEIRQWVAEGKTDSQIKAVLLQRYGTRILAMPEGPSLWWLLWMPLAALLAGLVLLVITIRGWRASASAGASASATDNSATPEIEWEWDAP